MDPVEMARGIAQGLLSFPVSHFSDTYEFLPGPYREHIAWLLAHRPAGLFAAGGTGEFYSLTLDEFSRVICAAAEEVAGRLPVVAGCGYGTAMARQFTAAAEKAGADGILLFPPSVNHVEQKGLARHIESVCASTRLGVIVYNRDQALVDDATLASLCERCPNLVGFKDGVGDIERMTRIYTRMGDRLTYIGGLPTAETFALPYMELGVTTYSSAIFNFLPDFANAFYAAVRARERQTIMARLRDFVMPYIQIRNRRKGYAVSIVKAGMRAVGRSAGPVRPPLVDLENCEMQELSKLVDGLS